MRRTSLTHPLAIAAIEAGPGMGRVGITFCPGKCQPNAATGAWHRDLEIDIAAIADWGAATVITLVEAHELVALQVNGLGPAVQQRHMDWLHLPIRDVSVPDAAFEAAWLAHGPALRSRLRAGFDVLVHCKGGLGRAGLGASRLLVDLGWPPNKALAAVRKVRPGAVETQAQEAYVLNLQAPADDRPDQSDRAIGSRAVASFLGLAVGDAVGTTLEFTHRDAGAAITDMVGGGPFALRPGEWTDDTAMALALADSLALPGDFDPADLMGRFVDWYRRGSYSCTGRCFDIGVTTRQALSRFEQGGDPFAGATDPMSAGNGSLMCLAPVAIRYHDDRDRLAAVAAAQSRTTHGAAEAVDACIAFADLLTDAIVGIDRDTLLAPRTITGAPAVAAVMDGAWRGKPRGAIRSSGYVLHSLEAALWCVARTGDFRSAVLLAANLGDDADTTAAITGQLAGAPYGIEGIPPAWLDRLAWRERLEAAAQGLLA